MLLFLLTWNIAFVTLRKKMDTQFAWAHALLFSWSVSSLCWWMSSKTPEKIWEVEFLKSLFWHHVYLIGWLVNHISSFKGLFCCCLAFRVAVENMDASYSVDFEHKKIYIYTHMHTHVFSLETLKTSLYGQCSEISQEHHWLCVFHSFCIDVIEPFQSESPCSAIRNVLLLLFKKYLYFIFGCVGSSFLCTDFGNLGLLFVAVHGFLIVMAPLTVEHRLYVCRLQ